MGEHHHDHDLKGRSLIITILLNIAITVVQAIGALLSNSLSLLSDALHNFSDVMALVISYIANKLSLRDYSSGKSYGYKRAEILAAFINAAALLGVSCYLIIESVDRFFSIHQPEVNGFLVALLAGFSIVANGISVLLVKKHSDNNMNMKSAYLHLFSDMLSSLAVMIGGIVMYYWHVAWVDVVLSIIIALYLIYSSWSLLVKTIKVLMQFTPAGIDVEELANHFKTLEGIKNIHHIHVWQLNDEEIHLEAHIDYEADVKISEANKIMGVIKSELKQEFKITHCTLQPEFELNDDKSLIVNGAACSE
ncbi:cation diffusion facilitator family transporter [Carboxylicivirga sp. N1Y90]|uniref:cation diffusion facilitator family transporter n=1 Tax=Carboxylicivirga fragile TaxID=3417571 RepID=UPI003D34B6ED|nr:cation transporter [Marinilabiliaceae bacterium N1Y90]